jgi:hypothetical protein
MNDGRPRRALFAGARRQRGKRAAGRALTIVLGVLLALALPVVAAAQGAPDSDIARPTPRPVWVSRTIQASVHSAYFSNPFNLRRHWDAAAADPGAGSRLDGYASYWDIVNTADVAVGYRWRVPSGGRYGLTAGGEYARYSLNPAHSRGRMNVSGSYRTPARSTSTVNLEWTPRTLAGNRSAPDTVGFQPAWYAEYQVGVMHRRRLTPKWTVRPAVSLAERRFEEPFGERTRRTIRLEARTDYEPTAQFTATLIGAGGRARPVVACRTENRCAFAYVEAAVNLTYQHDDWRVRSRARVREINFDRPAGLSDRGESRRDVAWRLDATLTRQITDRTSLWLQAGERSRSSDRYSDDLLESTASNGRYVRLGADFNY